MLFFRPAMIFMHGDLSWDQLQVMMSRSTTVDLLKMYYKLEEFFTQQFKSSKRVFMGRPGPDNSFRKRQPRKKTSNAESKYIKFFTYIILVPLNF